MPSNDERGLQSNSRATGNANKGVEIASLNQNSSDQYDKRLLSYIQYKSKMSFDKKLSEIWLEKIKSGKFSVGEHLNDPAFTDIVGKGIPLEEVLSAEKRWNDAQNRDLKAWESALGKVKDVAEMAGGLVFAPSQIAVSQTLKSLPRTNILVSRKLSSIEINNKLANFEKLSTDPMIKSSPKNVTIGYADFDDIIEAGKQWVGNGSRTIGGKKEVGWISLDKRKYFRFPKNKKTHGTTQANFELKDDNGLTIFNLHINDAFELER